jgi:GNAT superfamily N-acetyltransferase
MPGLRTEQLVVDLIGLDSVVKSWLSSWESVGFRPYQKLFRMTRPAGEATLTADRNSQRVEFAGKPDAEALMDMLCLSFDKYAEQLPTLCEIKTATESRQILVARTGETLAGLLYFEDQGFSSMVRYWLVGNSFRDRGFGSTLMRRYLTHDASVRRFLLWVIADNEHAIAKYRQHGFAPDGLFDYVLANEMIRR